MTTLYGIKNCDTIKKARKWLEEQEIPYQFHDFKTDGLSHELLTEFVSKSDWQLLLNKRSTTFRNLSDKIKENLTDDVMFNAVLEQPTLLKRPLLSLDNTSLDNNMHIGFKKEQYQELFS